MDITATKKDLINWLTELQDPDILKQIAIIRGDQDWWDELSEAERVEIDQGIAELDRGEGIPYQDVMKLVREKLKIRE